MFGFLKRWNRTPDRLSDFFAGAVYAYVLIGDNDARVAALAAGILASTLQRSGMIAWLQIIKEKIQTGSMLLPNAPPEVMREAASRLELLSDQLATKDWTVGEAISARKHLAKLSPEYGEALGRQDATIFLRKYPGIPLELS